MWDVISPTIPAALTIEAVTESLAYAFYLGAAMLVALFLLPY